MKILLYGNTANNLYIITKLLRKNNIEADFVIDQEDHLIFGQPYWQDVEMKIMYDDIAKIDKKKIEEHYKTVKWQKPEFVKLPTRNAKIKMRKGCIFLKLFYFAIIYLFKHQSYLKVLSMMKDYDLIIVNGNFPLLTTFLSGKKFIFYPYGKDLRIALDLYKNKTKKLSQKIYDFLLEKTSFQALLKSDFVVNGDAALVDYKGKIDKSKFVNVDFPIPKPDFDKIDITKLEDYLEISIQQERIVVLVPSRINYAVKGHQILINAIKVLPQDKYQFIFSGWGPDYPSAKKELANRVDVFFLKYVISKPLLMKMFHFSDVVIDQFVLGTYGTSAMEAMICKKSVVIHLDKEYFNKKGKVVPYYLEAFSSEEIRDILLKENKVSLADKGVKSMQWVENIHSEDKFVSKMKQLFESISNK